MAQQKIQSTQLDIIEITQGGTGEVEAEDAFNALAPNQSESAGLFLSTDGSTTSWQPVTSTPPDVFTLSLTTGGATFNGQPQTSWTGTTYVPVSYCSWDDYTSTVIFTEAAFYRITIIATVAADTPGDWPSDLSSFGTTVTNSLSPTSTRHSATVPTGFGMDFAGIASYTSAPPQNAAVWTDTYVISSDGADSQAIGVYAASYLASETGTNVQAFVTIERLGPGV